MADYTGYPLDPAIVSYLQGQPTQPPVDALATTLGPRGTGNTVDPTPPPPPPPPPLPGELSKHIGLFGAPSGDETPMYGGLPPEVVQGVQTGFAPPPGPEASPTVPSVTGGALPTDAAQAVPAAPVANSAPVTPPRQPDLAPVAIPQMNDKQVAASNAYYNSPEGQHDRALQLRQDAIDKGQSAIDQETQAVIDKNNAINAAKTNLDASTKATEDADAAKLAQDQEAKQRLSNQWMQDAKNAADYKVDTNRDVGVRGLIAIALSGIGDALDHRHGPNTALQIIDADIDKRINDQWAQKKSLFDKASMSKSMADDAQSTVVDDRALQDRDRAAARLKLADDIDSITRQYENPIQKARGDQMSAALREKAAQNIESAAQWTIDRQRAKQEEADRQAQLGIAQGNLALARKNSDREFALKVAELGLKQGANADPRAALSKDLATSGVFDPSSGSAVLDADGQKMVDQADALEVKARALPPDQAAQAKQQATQMRADAELLHGFRIEDKDARREVVNSVGAGQKLIDTIGRIKNVLAQDPSSVDRATWAGLETDFESAKADWIEAHKGKPSSREFEAISDMFGDDPSNMTTRLAGRSKIDAALDQLKGIAVSDTTTDLHKHGYKGTWRPRGIERDAVPQLNGQTSVEAADDATPGPAAVLNPLAGAASLGHSAFNAVTGSKDVAPDVAAENSGDVTPTGLTKADTQTVEGLIKRYKNAPDAQREKILGNLTAYVSSPRPALANGVLGLVKQDPQLYQAVVTSLSPQQRDALVAAPPTVQIHNTPIDLLATAAATGDSAAQTELIRRAGTGDALATQALKHLTGAR